MVRRTSLPGPREARPPDSRVDARAAPTRRRLGRVFWPHRGLGDVGESSDHRAISRAANGSDLRVGAGLARPAGWLALGLINAGIRADAGDVFHQGVSSCTRYAPAPSSDGSIAHVVHTVWAATTTHEDYIKMQGWKRVMSDVTHRKEVVAGNLGEYATAGKRHHCALYELQLLMDRLQSIRDPRIA